MNERTNWFRAAGLVLQLLIGGLPASLTEARSGESWQILIA